MLLLANPTLDTARACSVPGRMRSGASRVVWYALASSRVARSSPGSGRPSSPVASLPPPLRAPLPPERPAFSQSVVMLCNALQQNRQVRPRQRLPLVLPPAVQAPPICRSFLLALNTGLTMLRRIDLSLQCKASVSVPHLSRLSGPRSGENKASQADTAAAVGTRHLLFTAFLSTTPRQQGGRCNTQGALPGRVTRAGLPETRRRLYQPIPQAQQPA